MCFLCLKICSIQYKMQWKYYDEKQMFMVDKRFETTIIELNCALVSAIYIKRKNGLLTREQEW